MRHPTISEPLLPLSILEHFDELSADRRVELVREIRTESHGLIRMVENLLMVTKVDGDDVKLVMTDTVIEELVDTVAAKYNRHFPEMPLIIDIPDEFISVPMEAMLIQQVLFNLLENAVIHAKGMTELKLIITTDGEDVCFEVRDNGCGIPKDKLDSLFEQYHDATLVSATGVARRNMGIGLSVCHAIIKAHGSSIHADNDPEGGASFKFTLRRMTDEQ